MGIIFRNGIKYSGTRVVDDADHLFAEDTTGTSVSAQTMLTNILGDFATMEDSVAQENHTVGDYIVLGSYFYKVTDAITAGDTFVEGVNGNIERTNVGAEVNRITSDLSTLSSTVSSKVQDRVRVVNINGSDLVGLMNKDHCSFCFMATRVSANSAYAACLNRYNGEIFIKEIYNSGSFTIATNSYGSISVRYNNNTMGVYGVGLLREPAS